MYEPMTDKEFAVLRKLSNKARKHVTEIGKCSPSMQSIEKIELVELIDDATALLNYANRLYNRK